MWLVACPSRMTKQARPRAPAAGSVWSSLDLAAWVSKGCRASAEGTCSTAYAAPISMGSPSDVPVPCISSVLMLPGLVPETPKADLMTACWDGPFGACKPQKIHQGPLEAALHCDCQVWGTGERHGGRGSCHACCGPHCLYSQSLMISLLKSHCAWEALQGHVRASHSNESWKPADRKLRDSGWTQKQMEYLCKKLSHHSFWPACSWCFLWRRSLLHHSPKLFLLPDHLPFWWSL